MEITEIVNCGDDLLRVTATLDTGDTITATGWVSATTNHYDPAAYDVDGNLVAKATPRAMTPTEVGEYAQQLVLDQHPQLAAAVVDRQSTPEPVAFVAPAPLALAAEAVAELA